MTVEVSPCEIRIAATRLRGLAARVENDRILWSRLAIEPDTVATSAVCEAAWDAARRWDLHLRRLTSRVHATARRFEAAAGWYEAADIRTAARLDRTRPTAAPGRGAHGR